MPAIAWALVLMVASYVITAITMKTQNAKPTSLEDFDFPQVDEGTPHAVVFGDVWLDGWMVLWYGDFRTSKIKSAGKK